MVKKKFATSKTVKGRTYQYFRRDEKYIPLPSDPTSEEYDKAYWKLMRGGGVLQNKRTFDKLILSYRQSPKWKRLAPRTKKDYLKGLEYLHEVIGKKDPVKMRRVHVIEAQMANRHRARFAIYIQHMLSILFEHAINLDWMTTNPAKGVEKIVTGDGYQPWPPWALEIYRKHATGPVLLIFELALGTGQRIADVLKMKWEDIEDDGIYVVQNKTGAKLWIPMTERLRKVLADAPKILNYVVSDQYDRPIKYDRQQKLSLALKKGTGLGGLHNAWAALQCG